MNYSEKLKNPQWQRKRLEILNRDDFTCQCCGGKEITLHVHHFVYNNKTGNPWEVDDWSLITLCEDCHHLYEEKLPEIIDEILCVLQCSHNPINKEVGNISPFFRRWIIEIILQYYPKKKLPYGKG